jgi:hypothetical protein
MNITKFANAALAAVFFLSISGSAAMAKPKKESNTCKCTNQSKGCPCM